MNLCILIGKIITDIEFKFIINSKNKSIVEFEIETLDNNIVKVYGYNEIADRCYREFNKNDIIFIYGKLNRNGRITIEEVKKAYNTKIF